MKICAAFDCTEPKQTASPFCKPHWNRISERIRRIIFTFNRSGQEADPLCVLAVLHSQLVLAKQEERKRDFMFAELRLALEGHAVPIPAPTEGDGRSWGDRPTVGQVIAWVGEQLEACWVESCNCFVTRCKAPMVAFTWEGHTHMTDVSHGLYPNSMQYRRTKQADDYYWVNVCPKCDTVQGDNFVCKRKGGPLPNRYFSQRRSYG